MVKIEAEWYEVPNVMYLRLKENGNIIKREIIGRTTRSWLSGFEWNPDKYQFSKYEVVTEADYALQTWADKHRYNISQEIYHSRSTVSSQLMKQIAEMIGYQELPEEVKSTTLMV